MRPPCEFISKYVLPAFRALIARELIEKYEFSQMDAAKKLGITQATVNHYVYSKRGEKKLRQLETIPEIKETAEEIAYRIAYEQISTSDAITKFCRLCQKIRKETLLCNMHRDAVPYSLTNCNICPNIHL